MSAVWRRPKRGLNAIRTRPRHGMVPPRARAALGAGIVNQHYDEEAEKILAPVCKFLARHGIDAKSVHKAGAAGDAIAAQAAQGRFDLVVM